MGNGCFNYQTTSVISVNSVHSVQKTQLKCVFCMQVLQQPPIPLLSAIIVLRTEIKIRATWNGNIFFRQNFTLNLYEGLAPAQQLQK